MTRADWLERHAFLQPLARLSARIEEAVDRLAPPPAAPPAFDDFRDEYLAGVPLLSSVRAPVDLEPAARTVVALVLRLAAEPLPDEIASKMRALAAELRDEREPAAAVAHWLRGESEFTTASPGLLRWLGWTVLVRSLRPVVAAFARWRDEERWLRSSCPTCGALPSMALLVEEEHGRTRFLSCGCCATRWRYRRGACPFCEKESHKLEVVSIEGEGGLRIDWCEGCRGYLKTSSGRGDEELLLADWTSLHLDVVAHDRGLERKAASLYEIDAGARADDAGARAD